MKNDTFLKLYFLSIVAFFIETSLIFVDYSVPSAHLRIRSFFIQQILPEPRGVSGAITDAGETPEQGRSGDSGGSPPRGRGDPAADKPIPSQRAPFLWNPSPTDVFGTRSSYTGCLSDCLSLLLVYSTYLIALARISNTI